MASSSIFLSLFILQFTLIFSPIHSKKLFREYIGAEGKNVKFTDLPINNAVEFHFILSFAIDYTGSASPKPTNGNFNVFWDTDNLTPAQVLSIKSKHPNVRVAMSLGGDSVGPKDDFVFFAPASINSWVKNAISSITSIVKEYHLDGIDIDYEHFNTDTNTFAECIGRLIFALKQNNVVQIVSIAPYDDGTVNQYYLALWKKFGNLIDYVNFQFYAYDKGTTVSQFLKFYDIQTKNYNGGTLMASFGTDNSGGLKPQNGFFTACNMLASKGKLHGIFIWSADDSKNDGFKFEKQSQQLLGSVK